MWRLSIIVIGLVHCAGLHGYQDTTVVNTNCGPVAGIKRSTHVFKGIPYAEPPVSHLRWKPPVPKSREVNNCWNGIFKACSFGNSCVQTGFTNRTEMLGGEDCLYLNVWTPTTDRNAKLPVMVYIHGGYLNYFNDNTPNYSPSEELAINTNMVYVSMNYRLNAFVFMSLDIISDASPSGTSWNYGFMDQILVLQWVQENICNFGGNPNLVWIIEINILYTDSDYPFGIFKLFLNRPTFLYLKG
jgi:carboxylesterase type B